MTEPASFLVLPRHGSRQPALTRYDADPYTWALEQAALLREGREDGLDRINLADEITDLAHYLAGKLRSDLTRVLQHLIKWDAQPERRSRTWQLSIREHRRRTERHLANAPGLRSVLSKTIQEAYEDARDKALKEMNLPDKDVPEVNLYTWDDIMTREITWPED